MTCRIVIRQTGPSRDDPLPDVWRQVQNPVLCLVQFIRLASGCFLQVPHRGPRGAACPPWFVARPDCLLQRWARQRPRRTYRHPVSTSREPGLPVRLWRHLKGTAGRGVVGAFGTAASAMSCSKPRTSCRVHTLTHAPQKTPSRHLQKRAVVLPVPQQHGVILHPRLRAGKPSDIAHEQSESPGYLYFRSKPRACPSAGTSARTVSGKVPVPVPTETASTLALDSSSSLLPNTVPAPLAVVRWTTSRRKPPWHSTKSVCPPANLEFLRLFVTRSRRIYHKFLHRSSQS